MEVAAIDRNVGWRGLSLSCPYTLRSSPYVIGESPRLRFSSLAFPTFRFFLRILSPLAMTVELNLRARDAPSTKERIMAMREHSQLFEISASYPEAAVHQRFREQWARIIPYVESKVHRCMRAADASLRQDMSPDDIAQEEIDPAESGFTRSMDALTESLLLHCMQFPSHVYAASN